jgi:outer membrane beta-barrel protein
MFKHSLFVALTLTAALLAPTAHVWAQEGEETPASPQEQLEQDLALFWGGKRQVKIVQRREFIKDGKMEATVFGGVIPNDDFIFYITPGVRFGYHFTESLMVEGSFAYASEQTTELKSFLENSDIALNRADIREFIKMYYNVDILWSPIYGKLSFLGSKLTHFDTFIGLGVGFFHTSGRKEDDNPDFQSLTNPAANTVLGFRWHISELVNIRTEYRHYFFEKAIGGISKPVELTLGVGFTF